MNLYDCDDCPVEGWCGDLYDMGVCGSEEAKQASIETVKEKLSEMKDALKALDSLEIKKGGRDLQ